MADIAASRLRCIGRNYTIYTFEPFYAEKWYHYASTNIPVLITRADGAELQFKSTVFLPRRVHHPIIGSFML